MEITRRDFLKLMATSTVGAVVFNGCTVPEREMLMQSPLLMPEDMVTGLDNWYASICRQCPAGCGIIVRVIEGKAKKIEGNPDYPVNQGKLCARGQAGVQALYHPDRIKGPKRLIGTRGSGQYKDITWDEALSELKSKLQELRGREDTALLITGPVSGHLNLVVSRFASGFGAEHLVFESIDNAVWRSAIRRAFGQDNLPDFDIANANYLLSFGANFLETWGSPVRYSRAYGEFRQGRPGRRGTFVQVEPRFSMTAANADEWLHVNPGTEGVLALSMAHVIISQGLGDSAAANDITGGGGVRALDAYRPEEAAKITGVPVEKILEVARAFATQRPSLAIAGGSAAAYSNGGFNLAAVYALNHLVGSVGREGGIIFNPSPPIPELAAPKAAASFDQWEQLSKRLSSNQPKPVNLVMVHNANPVHGLPASLGMRTNLGRAGFVVSFSSFMDETTELADLILPDHNYLESWGDDVPNPGVGYQTIGLQQPVVNPLYNTRAFPDALLALAKDLGGATQSSLPWNSFLDLLKEDGRKLFSLNRGSVRAPDFDTFWNGVLQRGGWWDTAAKAQVSSLPRPAAAPANPPSGNFSGGSDYPFHLIPFTSMSVTDGSGAHLPWLQSMPDPVTTMTWMTWAEINPRTAENMKIKEGDILVVESQSGSIRVPAYIHPAIPPKVIAIPIGQGHTAFGRYAAKRGQNVFSVLAPIKESETGALAWASTKVRISRTGENIKMPKIEGSVLAVEPEDVDIVQVTPS